MADVHSKETRSYNMSMIRGKNTKPEIIVRKYLFSKGLRFRIHTKLPGRPDIVLPGYKVIIFIHGCFWHGHDGCKYFVVPKTRRDWWLQKISGTAANDARNILTLEAGGWKVIVVWECDLRKDKVEGTLAALYRQIGSRV